MKAINAIFVSIAGLSLGACSITIDGESAHHRYDDYADYMSITLPSGEVDRLSCPQGTSAFVINNLDEGKGLAYGCKTNDANIPGIGD